MSWLWGGRKPPLPENFTDYVPPTADGGMTGAGGGDDHNADKKGGAMDTYRFDSSALERAANAAKALENNRK